MRVVLAEHDGEPAVRRDCGLHPGLIHHVI
jgi:hypothetical protein